MPIFVSFAASIAELAHGEKSGTQSLTQLIRCPGNQSACASEKKTNMETEKLTSISNANTVEESMKPV